jgi:choline dehydrogenase-like flavoprotein
MGEVLKLPEYVAENGVSVSDIIVIGSGPAGYFAAWRLVSQGRHVVVLEAGDARPDLDASQYVELDGNGFPARRANLGLSWQLGGASNLWAGRSAPLEESDMTPENGWPLKFDELEPYYDVVAKIMDLASMEELRAEGTGISLGSDWAGLTGDPAVSLKRFQWSVPPFNTRHALLKAATRFENLTVVTGARVLSFDCQDGAVTHAYVASTGGDSYRLSAKTFVLAAGGVESPRILLNSDGGTGLGNSSGRIGAYFSTHPKMNIGTLELKRPVSIASPLFTDITRGDKNLRFGLGFAQLPEGSSRLNHYVQFSQRFEKIGTYAIEEAQRLFSRERNRGRGGGAIGAAAVALGQIVFNTLGRSGIWRKRASTLTLRGFFDQHAHADNRVELSEDKDLFGMAKARIHWDVRPEDAASILSFAADLEELFERHDIGKLTLTLPDDPKDWPLTSIHSHFLGTLRMGDDPETSVTNADGRLHDVENVYICGSGVFPSYGNANPFLSIAALALRTADRIKDTAPH